MPFKYPSALVFSAILFLASSFVPSPVNALSIDNGLQARHAHLGQALAKRQTNKRCKPRSSPAGGTSTSLTTPSPSPTPNPPKPATTTTPQTPASTPASGSSGGGGKACLAFAVWDNNVPTILDHFKTNHVSCIYNWGPTLVPGASQRGYEAIPMLWGTKDVAQWKQLAVAGYAHYALGFNEPDHRDQAYMEPGYACQLWRENMLPLRNLGYTLISPATTSSPDGITWMQNFFNACGGSSVVDKIAIHWYGVNPQELIQYIQKWHDTFQKPIWVTEFACQDFTGSGKGCNDVEGFARTVRGFMDGASYVERYAPFAISYNLGNVNGVNQLLGGNLAMTNLAHIYLD